VKGPDRQDLPMGRGIAMNGPGAIRTRDLLLRRPLRPMNSADTPRFRALKQLDRWFPLTCADEVCYTERYASRRVVLYMGFFWRLVSKMLGPFSARRLPRTNRGLGGPPLHWHRALEVRRLGWRRNLLRRPIRGNAVQAAGWAVRNVYLGDDDG
jgi:hypothetical protein